MPDDAFIMPDEPMDAPGEGERTGFADGAFIDPDAPIVRRDPPRKPADYEVVLRRAPALDLEDVVVTGIGDDPHLEDEDAESPLAASRDPHLAEVVRAVERLAEALRTRGEAGLRAAPDMTRFEATLRAYCVGYLAGAGEGDESH